MMAAPGVVISQATASTPAIGSLFNGTAFFLVQRLPSRSSFVDRIQANGGRVVKLEMQADYIIADHVRRDCPPGSLSYTFIEAAIRDSTLPDPDDHRAGPAQGTKREVGSTAIPPKGTRTPFTAEDDRVLWEWVEGSRRRGGMVKGNEIYKALEDKNPRHTFQAWRDRYIKKLMDRPPPPGAKVPEDEPHDETGRKESYMQFTDDDFDMLKSEIHSIRNIDESQIEDAWTAWADAWPEHTAAEWRQFYEEVVLPAYLEEEAGEAAEPKGKGKEKKADVQVDKKTAQPAVKRELLSNTSGGSDEQITPMPASASKRKRETPTPRSKAYGNKRAKPSNADIFAENESAHPTRRGDPGQMTVTKDGMRPILDLARQSQQVVELGDSQKDGEHSGDNHVASKAHARQTPSPEAAKERFATSSANRAAQAQLIAENSRLSEDDGEPLPQVRMQLDVEDTLPTSEANRTARAQLIAEANQPDSDPAFPIGNDGHLAQDASENGSETGVALAPGAADPVPLNLSEEAARNEDEDMAESEEGEPGFPPNQPGDGLIGLYDLIPPRGIDLTEANLASQQAQHKPEVSRGKDLPEDDENQDHGDYAEYLQRLMGIKPAEDPKPGAEAVAEVPDRLMDTPEEQNDDLVELESDRELSSEPEAEDAEALPMDSDQVEVPQTSHAEIDDVFTQNMDWPMSPAKAARPGPRQQESQSQAFETQVQYPSLPYPGQDDQEDDLPSSQPFQPSPPQASKTSHTAQPKLPQLYEAEDGAQAGWSSNIDLTVPEPDGETVDDEDGDIDLTIPEPEGGFDFSSQEERVDAKPSIDAVLQDDNATMPPQQRPVAERVDISSDDSSSSAISDEEPVQVPNSSVPLRQPTRTLETQAIVDADSQPMDFGMPLPNDSDEEDDDLPTDPLRAPPEPAPPVQKSKTGKAPSPADDTPRQKPRQSTGSRRSTYTTQRAKQSLTSRAAKPQPEEPEDLETFLYRLTSRGYARANIVDALRRTSMRSKLAEIVLIEEKRGNKVTDIPGVWTKEEDDILTGSDARKLKQLEKKHGWDEFQARVEFLQQWEAE